MRATPVLAMKLAGEAERQSLAFSLPTSASTARSLLAVPKHTWIRLRREPRLLLARAKATSRAAQLCTKCCERVGSPSCLERASRERHSRSAVLLGWRRGGTGGAGGSLGRSLALKVVECDRLRRGRYEVIIRGHKSGAGNVPLFHPGSGGAAAWISGDWSHPGGQTARKEEAGRARGEGRKWVGGVTCREEEEEKGEEGGEGRGVAGLDLLNAK